MSVRREQILDFIRINPDCTTFDISSEVGITPQMIRNYLRELKRDSYYKDILQCKVSVRDSGTGRPYTLYSLKED